MIFFIKTAQNYTRIYAFAVNSCERFGVGSDFRVYAENRSRPATGTVRLDAFLPVKRVVINRARGYAGDLVPGVFCRPSHACALTRRRITCSTYSTI